jgi:hypothetical protein
VWLTTYMNARTYMCARDVIDDVTTHTNALDQSRRNGARVLNRLGMLNPVASGSKRNESQSIILRPLVFPSTHSHTLCTFTHKRGVFSSTSSTRDHLYAPVSHRAEVLAYTSSNGTQRHVTSHDFFRVHFHASRHPTTHIEPRNPTRSSPRVRNQINEPKMVLRVGQP